jgi:ribosome-binding factor A
VSRRTARIASELLAELARLLRQEVTDPRVGLVTLTRVDVAPDLSHSLVFWSALDVDEAPDRVAERQAGLDSASQFLRHRVAGKLSLRRMPELRFRYDPSLVLGSRTLSVLREVAPLPPDDAESGGARSTPGEPDQPGQTDAAGSEHGSEK